MGIYNDTQIAQIIKTNPNAGIIKIGREANKKLMLHLHGVGMQSALDNCDYFEHSQLYEVRKKYAISNKDVYGRLLQQEDIVFSAKGGSAFYNLPEAEEKQMNAIVDKVRFGMPLRKWVKTFAREAYRADPMGVIFMEVTKTDPANPAPPRAYPTYKGINTIYDYLPNGRYLEYICFNLTAGEAVKLGAPAEDLKEYEPETKTIYYRFVDDARDLICKFKIDENGGSITVINSEDNNWEETPAFVVSDIMMFTNPQCFLSPLNLTVELADCFLTDRSVRDLQKKYHGFSKPIEPLLSCVTCDGTGFVSANPCPKCTPPGGDRGTGYNMYTKIGDVARFPLEILKDGFDFNKIFGYVTPDVKGWEKQDMSLDKLEYLINMTYWGTAQSQTVNGPSVSGGSNSQQDETATKTTENRQPRLTRLNQNADWAEKTESMIADFLGKFWFPETFKKSSIAYGRHYILETPDELWDRYQKRRSGGAPEASLYEALEDYYSSAYQNNPLELAARLKLLYVEPFPHMRTAELQAMLTDPLVFNCKLYFGEWYSQLKDMQIIVTPLDKLRQMLTDYVKAKNIPAPEPQPAPGVTK